MDGSYVKKVIFILITLFWCGRVVAQTTKVSGRVFDQLTGEPVSFATLQFAGTSVGKNADIDGNYSLETSSPVDSLRATFIGYLPVTVKVKRGQTQVLDIAMRVNKFDLPEVTINAGENPAIILLRKVIDNKPVNDRERLQSYQYEAYNKIEFDVNKITEKFTKRKLFKPFKFVFNNLDSSNSNQLPFLPVFLTESVSDIYYRKNPKLKKEIIHASKVSGVENKTVSQYLGDLYSNINIYDNYIYLFSKGFVSPISGIAQAYYKYMLVDSMYIQDKWCYKVTFHPRRKQELTFSGEFWVHDSTFAIRKVNMRITGDANINFIEDLAFVQDYDHIDDKQWMLTKEVLVVNLAPTETKNKETTGFIGRKTTFYRNFVLDRPMDETFFKEGNEVILKDDAYQKSGEYWDSTRGETLADREKKIYAMIDTIKTVPAYKTWTNLVYLAASGYKEVGLFEIGPIYTFLSGNPIEGIRLRVGGQTSNAFSTRLILSGYTAYGLRDEKFKFGGKIRYFLDKDPRTIAGLEFKRDVEQLGKSPNAFADDNFFAALFRRTPANQLNQIIQGKGYLEREWLPGLSTRITLSHSEYKPLGELDFTYYTNDSRTDSSSDILNTEATLYIRYARNERYLSGEVDRVSLGTNWPIFHVQYSRGMDILNGGFTYNKLRFRMDDYLYPGNFGLFNYSVEAGKVWESLPYPLLFIQPGNNTFVYDKYSFNLMNFYEFVCNQYVSFKAEHHFGGLFLDRVPALRRLKWREVATFSAVAGYLTDANKEILANPNAFFSLRKPYAEAGIGIENIFKIFRIDNIWRLSYLDNPGATKTAIFVSAKVSF